MNIYIIIPILIYLLITIMIGFYANNLKSKSDNFLKEYYIGDRNLNGFVLAMTIVSTYVGASSFISGPAIVYRYGLSWVLLACTQIPVVFLTLGILGKKLAIISRKINAITIIDVIKARFKNKYLIILISCTMLVFLITSTVAQFIGGARLIETIIGIKYEYALTIFSLFIIFYTTIGGFRAIVISDTIQTIIMIISIIIIFVVLLIKGQGMSNITNHILQTDYRLITPDFNGGLLKQYIASFFILVGIGILALPAIAVRCISYKNTKSLHKSIIYGSLTIGFIIIGIHLIGYMSILFIQNQNLGDKLIPTLVIQNLHPLLVGIFIGGPLFAIMSSVDSFLIIISSTIVKDLYVSYIKKDIDNKHLKKISITISLIIGLLIYIISFRPISLIVWINLFALSGQEVIFFVPVIFGLFSKKATDFGVISAIISGFLLLIIMTIFKINILGLHNIVPVFIISIMTYFIFNRFGKKIDKETKKIFF